jgi:biphenyl 2,3-dioxygenase subunit beta
MPPSEAETKVRPRSARVSPELQHEVEQFLYEEAALLDAHEMAGWLELFAADLRYFMPLHTSRGPRERAQRFSGDRDIAYFDESKASLAQRLRKLETGMAWAEEPPSRTRHFVNNVRIRPGEAAEEFEVNLVFSVSRSRSESQNDLLMGERRDLLRRVPTEAGFQIARRTILLDQATLLANNISFFF